LVGLLFLRRERLTLEDLEKQLETAGPALLTQYDRLKYEKSIKDAETEAKPILESLQNSPGMEIIRKRRRDFDYKTVLDKANLNLQDFLKKYQNQIVEDIPVGFGNAKRKGFKEPTLDAKFIELSQQVSKINNEINNKPLTIDEGIIIEEPYLIQNIRNQLKSFGFNMAGDDDQVKEIARSFNINTSSRLQQIKDSVADIREKLRKDDELLKELQRRDKEDIMKREREMERTIQELAKKTESKETAVERMRRERREKTVARKKAQAEARAESEAKAKSETEAKAKSETEAKAEEEARVKAEAKAKAEEEIKMSKEEMMKINNARKEAEQAMNQLREIPLEERIRRKIFVQPKMNHKPYPYVRSTPATPPYDTTKYEKRQNLFKTSEISSIFPRPISLVYLPNTSDT